MSDLQAACERLIAVVGERHDKSAPVTFNGAEWEAFVAALAPPPPPADPPPAEEPPAEEPT